MKRVLVTGATGFVGQCCLPLLLARGYEVHAVSSRARTGGSRGGKAETDEGISWHHANLMDPGQAATVVAEVAPTHLLHLAWYVEPGKLATASENFQWVQASLELLRRFGEHEGQRVVMAGSAYEYDWRYGYCTERLTPTAPVTYYGACKLALAHLLDAYALHSGLSHAWARLFFLYGPREDPRRLVSSVIRSLVLDQPARCSHGRQIRDYLHVEDVADALVTLLHGDVRGAVNLGSGQPVTLREMVGRIASTLGKEHLVQFGAIPSHPHDAPLVVADVTRLFQEVGWRPTYDLDRGLEATVEWWNTELQVPAGT